MSLCSRMVHVSSRCSQINAVGRPFLCSLFSNWLQLTIQLLCIILVLLILFWESEGIRLPDLTDHVNQINYRNPIYFYLGIAFLTMVYSIGMIILGSGGFEIPAITVSLASHNYDPVWFMLFIASPHHWCISDDLADQFCLCQCCYG